MRTGFISRDSLWVHGIFTNRPFLVRSGGDWVYSVGHPGHQNGNPGLKALSRKESTTFIEGGKQWTEFSFHHGKGFWSERRRSITVAFTPRSLPAGASSGRRREQ